MLLVKLFVQKQFIWFIIGYNFATTTKGNQEFLQTEKLLIIVNPEFYNKFKIMSHSMDSSSYIYQVWVGIWTECIILFCFRFPVFHKSLKSL